MRDLAEILARLRALEATGAPAWLVTIARVEGSSYRREGTRLLVESDGRLTGVLSGGCLERDVAALAAAATRPRTHLYDLTADEEAIWGMGTGCAGRVTLLVEPLDPPRRQAEIAILQTLLESRHEIRRATVFDSLSSESVGRGVEAVVGDRLVLSSSQPFYGPFFLSPEGLKAGRDLETLKPGEARAVEIRTHAGSAWVLLESILPPVHLLIVGAERDAPPLARIGRELGWAVTVVDFHPTEAAAARFDATARYLGCAPREIAARVELSARTAVVLATHRYLDDLAALEALLAAPVGHLALLGPVRRRERLLADLDRRIPEASAALGERLRSPAGLDLGGRAPEEVALAVVAEVQAAFCGRDARPLGERPAAEAATPAEARP